MLRRCCGPGCATVGLPRRSANGTRAAWPLGRKSAVADFGRLKLTGVPAWWLWGAVHVMFLLGVRNRLWVILGWVWSYSTFDVGVRLITDEGTRRLSPSHTSSH
jgi:hypothetical protein